MVTSHTALGIAQTTFYLPAAPLSIYLMVRNKTKHSKRTWWPLIPLTILRLAGGIVLVNIGSNPDSIGLIIAAIVLLNVGAIPLLVQAFGLLRIVLRDEFKEDPRYCRIVKAIRLSFIPAIVLLATGSGLTSVNANIARALVLAGYILFACILVLVIALGVHLWKKRLLLSSESRRIVLCVLLAAVPTVVRNLYGILEVAFQETLLSVWNPLYGSAILLALMALLMEYIALCIYMYLGFSIVTKV